MHTVDNFNWCVYICILHSGGSFQKIIHIRGGCLKCHPGKVGGNVFRSLNMAADPGWHACIPSNIGSATQDTGAVDIVATSQAIPNYMCYYMCSLHLLFITKNSVPTDSVTDCLILSAQESRLFHHGIFFEYFRENLCTNMADRVLIYIVWHWRMVDYGVARKRPTGRFRPPNNNNNKNITLWYCDDVMVGRYLTSGVNFASINSKLLIHVLWPCMQRYELCVRVSTFIMR